MLFRSEDDLEELFSKEGPLDSVDFESSTRGVVKFRSSNDGTPLLHYSYFLDSLDSCNYLKDQNF